LLQANCGTLFLDEVADIPPATQAKLLRALEYREVLPVGANEPMKTDFRVISATHRNLEDRVAGGLFRHDLYFRLCAFSIHLPPLRERPDDIADLAEYFTTELANPPGTPKVAITAEALSELQSRPWYGNIRELRNTIDHALILARGRAIVPEHLPPPVKIAPEDSPRADVQANVVAAARQWAEENAEDVALHGQLYERLVGIVEPPLLDVALQRYKGQIAKAARALGLHRTTLRKKLEEHGLSGADRGPE
jgi:two-component system nitrogen regulation response regulator GlnG